jgi:LAO/AO transport system kinase
VLDAAGKGTVIIETVGVGQGEVEIAAAADITILILVPGTGDDVQALKAGVMEIADIFVVNKADREGADRLVQAITSSLALKEATPGAWQPPVLKTVATEGTGIDELNTAIKQFLVHQESQRAARRRARDEQRLRQVLAARVLQRVRSTVPDDEWNSLVDAVSARHLDPYSAVAQILARAEAAADKGPHA